jgi:N-acetylmuramoyl-L-alanine amidase
MRNLFYLFISSLIFCFLNIGHSADVPMKNVKMKLHTFDGVQYISGIEFAETQNIRTIFYEDKEKLEFRFPESKVTISPHSSYIKVDDKIFHMYLPVIYDGTDFFIPAEPFMNILNKTNLPNAAIDSSEEYVVSTAPLYNVNNVKIVNKVNGTIIKIQTEKQFSQSVISASITGGGWLNLTIAGALIDSSNIVNSPVEYPVMRIRAIQSKESAQISFMLKAKVDDYEINTTKNEISITLRVATAENADRIKEMRSKWLLDTIVIDAGHGGKDSGAIGKGGLLEKTVTLDVAKKLGQLIEREMGVNVIYTRDEDVFIPLWKRTKIANDSGGKVFISIHVNSSPSSRSAKGFETYLLRPGKTKDAIDVASRENGVIQLEERNHDYKESSNENLILATMAQSSFMKESEYLAAEIQKELDRVLSTPNRGVKQAGFHVLVGASMPNVLIELGFISNSDESKLLGRSSYRRKIARSIFNALVNFKDKYETPLIVD